MMGTANGSQRRYVIKYSLRNPWSCGMSTLQPCSPSPSEAKPFSELYVYQVYHAYYITSNEASGILPWKEGPRGRLGRARTNCDPVRVNVEKKF